MSHNFCERVKDTQLSSFSPFFSLSIFSLFSFQFLSLSLSWISSSKNCVNQKFVSSSFRKIYATKKFFPLKAEKEKPLNLTSLFSTFSLQVLCFFLERKKERERGKKIKKKHSPRSRSKETSLTDSRVEGGFSVGTGLGKGRKVDTEMSEKILFLSIFKKEE